MTSIFLLGTVRTEPIEQSVDDHTQCTFRLSTTGPSNEPIVTSVQVDGQRARWLLDSQRLTAGAHVVVYGELDRNGLTGSYTVKARAVAFDEYLMDTGHV